MSILFVQRLSKVSFHVGRRAAKMVATICAMLFFATVTSSAVAQNILQKATDANGTSSFTSPLTGAAGGWGSGGTAATAGNSYEDAGGFQVRSPGTNSTLLTFAGTSLQIDVSGGTEGRFIMKGTGTSLVNSQTCSVNLILNGGYADEAASSGNYEVLAGAVSLIAPSALGALGGSTLQVNSTISGSSLLTINGGQDNSGNDSGIVIFNAANNFTGGVTISSGTLQTAVNNALPAASVLSFNGNSGLNLAGTTSQTILGLTGTTNNTWSIQNIGAGQTLNISSSASNAVVNLNNSTTTISGLGTLAVTATNGSMLISSLGNATTLSMSGLNTFTASVNAFDLGINVNAGGASVMNLAASNTINANTMYLSNGSSGNGGMSATMNLGATNSFNVGNLFVATGKANGVSQMTWATGQSGTLTLAGSSVSTPRAEVTLGLYNVATGNSPQGAMNLTAGTVNALIDVLTLGEATVTVTASQSTAGTFNFSAGSVSVNTIIVGQTTAGVTGATGSASGNFTIGGGTLQVNNALTIASDGGLLAPSGSFNLNGGVALIDSNITGGGGTSVFNFNGGTLMAGTSSTTFLQGLSAANVGNNGAVVNTNGNNITIGQALLQSGSGGLTKAGAGILTLAGNNTYTGVTTISAGTLQLTPGVVAIPTGAGAGNVTLNATLDVNGTSPTLGGLSGTGTLNSSVAGTPTVFLGNNNASSVFGGVIANSSGTMALAKIGSGTLTLSGPNTYSGATTISAGTLALSNAGGNNIAASQTINVATGATLNVMALSGSAITLGAAQTLTGFGAVSGGVATNGFGSTVSGGSAGSIGTLTMANLDMSAGGNLGLLLGTAGTSATSPGVGSLVNVTGNVTLPSTQIANLTITDNHGANGQGSLGNGFYDLLNYSGSLIGSPSTAFGSSVGARNYAFTTIAGSPNQLVLQISVLSLNWTGLSGGTGAATSSWDTVSTNWSNNADNSAVAYADGAVVAFGDVNAVTGGSISNSNIALNSVFQPTSITFSNSAVNYTISGSGGIAGATGITLNGTGVVSLQTSNSFTSPVAINAGALNISNPAALGNSSLATVASGGALQIQGGIATTTAIPLTLNGSGLATSPAGALNNVSGNNTYSGAITLGSPTTIDASSGTLTLSGGVTNGGNLLTIGGSGTTIFTTLPITGSGGVTVTASGTAVFAAANNNYSGATTVNAGSLLQLGTSSAPIPTGAAASNVTINGTLDLNGFSAATNGLSGSGLVTSVAGGTPTLTIGNNNATNTFAGAISDGGGVVSLIKVGTGTLTLAGSNTFSGGATISAGTLNLANAAAAQNSTVTVGPANGLLFSPSIGTFTIGGLSGAGGFALADTSGGTVALQIGGNNASTTYTGIMSGSGGLLKVGAGNLTLTNSNSFEGGAIVSGGTLTLAFGSIGLNEGTIGGPLTINPGATVVVTTPKGIGFASSPSGNVTVLTINQALLNYTGTSNSDFGLGGGQTVYLTGGTIETNGGVSNSSGTGFYRVVSNSVDNSIYVLASTANSVISGNVSMGSSGTFNVAGGATLLVSAALSGNGGNLYLTGPGTIELAGAGNFTGGSVIQGGALVQLGNAKGLGAVTSNLTVNSGTLDLAGFSPTVGALNVAAGSMITSSISGAMTLTTSSAANATYAGQLDDGSGTVSLVKSLTGALVLSGINNFSGNVTVNGGNLVVTNSASLGSGTKTITSTSRTGEIDLYGNITFDSGKTFVVSNDGTANGTVAIRSVGNNAILGGIELATGGGGTDIESDSGSLTIAGSISAITTARSLILSGTAGGAVSGVISDGSTIGLPVTLNGPSTWVFSASNSYTGATTISGGTLQLGDGVSNDGSVAGNITNNGLLLFNILGNQTYGGAISGSGALTKIASGAQYLAGAMTYTGAMNVGTGTLGLQNNGDINSSSVSIASAATLLAYASGASSVDFHTIPITGPGTLTVDGDNSGTIFQSRVVVRSASNNLTGTVNITPNGRLWIDNGGGQAGATIGTATVNNNGILALYSAGATFSAAIGGLNGNGSIVNEDGDGNINTLTIGAGGGSGSFSGNISEVSTGVVSGLSSPLAIIKTGTGTQILSGSNSYSGGTTVASGVLVLDGAASLLAGSSLTIGSGAGPGAIFAPPLTASQTPSAVNLAPVPEPGTFIMLGIAAIVGMAMRKRVFVDIQLDDVKSVRYFE